MTETDVIDSTPAPSRRHDAPYAVALVLSVGIAVALNVCVIALALDAGGGELSENGTQILAAWGGGMLGVIGASVGYHVGSRRPAYAKDGNNT